MPLRSESPPQKRSSMARVLEGSRSFTCTPTRSSSIGMTHTCLCLPSRSWWFCLIYRPRRDGRLSRPRCEVAQAEIQTRNLPIALDFIVNGFFMKLFKTNNIDVVKSCQSYFGFSLPSEEWAKREKNLDAKYIACERAFVHYGNTMFH